MFILVELCGLTYTEAWNMPIAYRKWWVERKKKWDASNAPDVGGRKK